MIPEKLTPERFRIRLKDGAYAGVNGARRAIGKGRWSEKEVREAIRLADEYFRTHRARSEKKRPYLPLSLERFRLKLQEGLYKSRIGVNRAIGKCTDWTAKERLEAHALADAYFGEHARANAPESGARTSIGRESSAKTKTSKGTERDAAVKTARRNVVPSPSIEKDVHAALLGPEVAAASLPSDYTFAQLEKFIDDNLAMQAAVEALRPLRAAGTQHRDLYDRTVDTLLRSYVAFQDAVCAQMKTPPKRLKRAASGK